MLDADVWGYSIPRMLGLGGQRPKVSPEKKILPLEAHGLKVISIGFFLKEDEAVVWRGPMLHKALTQFLEDVALGRARLPADRPAAGHRRRLDDALPAAAAGDVHDRHDAAGRRPEGRAPRRADGRQGQPRDLGRDREHVRLHRAGRRALPDLRRGRRPAPGRRARRAAARPGPADDAAARARRRRHPARGGRSRRPGRAGDPPRRARADRARRRPRRSRCRSWTSSRPARRSPSGCRSRWPRHRALLRRARQRPA